MNTKYCPSRRETRLPDRPETSVSRNGNSDVHVLKRAILEDLLLFLFRPLENAGRSTQLAAAARSLGTGRAAGPQS